jgi:hypothetical protein
VLNRVNLNALLLDEGGTSILDQFLHILSRYLYDGYLACVKSWGMYDARLNAMIEEAKTSLEKHAPDALEKVERAVLEIKSKGIP